MTTFQPKTVVRGDDGGEMVSRMVEE